MNDAEHVPLTDNKTGRPGRGAFKRYFWRIFFAVLLPAAVLFAGARTVIYLLDTAPKAERKSSGSRKAKLVTVQAARVTREITFVHAMGTVKPARIIQLQPRVSGEVIEVSDELMPGGIFQHDDLILRIDPTDFELIVRQRNGELANAESAHALELGNQFIAEREYELLGESILEEDRDLVLRKPQLRTVEAAVDIAKAVLEKAKLNLERTTVRAPFNAMVDSYEMDLGAQVSITTRIATLVGTDEYWVELAVPVDQLKWIEIPGANREIIGARVRVYDEAAWGEGLYRMGRVIRLAGDLEEAGRMARLLVSVPDPLSLEEKNAGAPRMIRGSYVRVEIEGIPLNHVIAVPWKLLREGDSVWVLNEEGLLDIRKVSIAKSSRDRVLISEGIAEGERIIVTDLSAPVPHMPLRVEKEEAPLKAGPSPVLDSEETGHREETGQVVE